MAHERKRNKAVRAKRIFLKNAGSAFLEMPGLEFKKKYKPLTYGRPQDVLIFSHPMESSIFQSFRKQFVRPNSEVFVPSAAGLRYAPARDSGLLGTRVLGGGRRRGVRWGGDGAPYPSNSHQSCCPSSSHLSGHLRGRRSLSGVGVEERGKRRSEMVEWMDVGTPKKRAYTVYGLGGEPRKEFG